MSFFSVLHAISPRVRFSSLFSVLFWEVSGGRLYVLVMAMVGYGSVLLLVSCASLRSNGQNMGMLMTDMGLDLGFVLGSLTTFMTALRMED